MKVILLEDVKALGKKGDMVEVNNGYARNFILPKKLGVEATGKNINDLKLQKAHQDKVAAEQLAAAQALADKVKDKTVTLKAKGGASGRLFGKVTAKAVAEALSKVAGTEIDKRKVELARDIKDFGTYSATVKLHPGVSAPFKVKVEEL